MKKILIPILFITFLLLGATCGALLLVKTIGLIVNERKQENRSSNNICTQKQLVLKKYREDSGCMVYGDSSNNSLSEKELLCYWNSRERKVPTELMLAKAFIESSYRPFIFRYEKALPYYYPHIKDSIQFTDLGMFQVLGMAIPHIKTVHEFPIEYQMDVFDSMMNACLIRANNDIKVAVHYYNTPALQYTENHNSNYTFYLYNKIKNGNKENLFR